MSCGDSTTTRPLQFRFPASDYVPPVPAEIAGTSGAVGGGMVAPQDQAANATYNYLLDLRKQLVRMFDATKTVTQDIQAPVVLQVNGIVNQSLAAATAEKVEFTSVRYDTHSYWSPTNHRFNPRIAGFYRISWSVCFASEAGGDNLCTAQLVVSGREDVKAQARNSSATKQIVAATSTNLYLDGDSDIYIEIWATAGAATDIVGDPALTFLTVDYVGDIHFGALFGSNAASQNIDVLIRTDYDSVRGQKPPPPTGAVVVSGLAPTIAVSAVATPFVYDTFTDTNGTDISAHTPEVGTSWAYDNSFGTLDHDIDIFTGTPAGVNCANKAFTNAGFVLANPTAPSANYYVEAVIEFNSSAGTFYNQVDLIARHTSSTIFYFVEVQLNNGVNSSALWINLYEGDGTLLDFYQGAANSAFGTHTVKFRLNGTALAVDLNTVEVCSATNSYATSAGKVGLYIQRNANSPDGQLIVDEFTAQVL